MPVVPNPHCVEEEIKGEPGFEAYLEIANIILCIVHITFITRNSVFKSQYKIKLLPVIWGQLIQSICVVIVNIIPFAKCYYHTVKIK
ncbi:hypothetical protein PRIPAC_73847 [Pristionchus pacificus]|uniref:Uncharacterized protein n=1 Tax=Pristionchus pacificus TaxID=54126 RepID=A0A2A6C7I3_PRIPA|nr:hypothetical protein PRIPAC_73847 [Pristionchus pacificus]|eukprot:PDM74155.1 hypothetical protein PRIPAC_41511 [Pristionchus pacificus]